MKRGHLFFAAIVPCALSGALAAAAFPPASAWPLAWVALAPFFWVAFTAPPGRALAAGWLAGTVLVGAVMYWIARFGLLPWILLSAIEGLAAALTVALVLPVRGRPGLRRVVLAAAAWAGCEWLRSLGPYGVPWAQLGHSQAPVLPVAQAAAAGGVEELSFFLALFGAAIADAFARGPRRLPNWSLPIVIAGVTGVLAASGYGRVRFVEAVTGAAPKMRVALIQGSVEPDLTSADVNRQMTVAERERYMSVYERLTEDAASQHPDLIVWPESAVPGDPESEPDLRSRLGRIAAHSGAWMIVGAHHYTGTSEFNSAFLISPDGEFAGRYDKVHLVPFGEYVPGRKWLPLLDRYNVLGADISPGRAFTVWRLPTRVGPMICFESAFPWISQILRSRGAQVLVIITNDAWFGKTAAADQHFQIGRFRSIEQGAPLVRAAASGISGSVLPDGRVLKRTSLTARQAIVVDVPVKNVPTVYHLAGRFFGAACFLVAGLAALADALRRKPSHPRRRH